jgi:hypothetical protein
MKDPSSVKTTQEIYANRFQVDASAEETRIKFGNAGIAGEVDVHTTIAMSPRNAIELANLILRLVSLDPQKVVVLN